MNSSSAIDSQWEEAFVSWSKPPSDTEQAKAENAEKSIKSAISDHPRLSSMDLTVFAHGSYKANTNIRLDSDVDICVRLNSSFFYRLPDNPPNRPEDFGIIANGFQYSEFKDLVEAALTKKFGASHVTRGKKAIDVHENSYRLDADVVPAFEHRRYQQDRSFLKGIEFRPDNGGKIINWPEQTYENGVQKNINTGKRYKQIIRILKKLRNYLQENNVAAAKDISSSLIESLVWNVPNFKFGHDTYGDDLREVLAHTFNATLNDQDCGEWGEVNELKYLFKGQQPWTREQAHDFLSACWNFVGFK